MPLRRIRSTTSARAITSARSWPRSRVCWSSGSASRPRVESDLQHEKHETGGSGQQIVQREPHVLELLLGDHGEHNGVLRQLPTQLPWRLAQHVTAYAVAPAGTLARLPMAAQFTR